MPSRFAIVALQVAILLGLAEAAARFVEHLRPQSADIAFDYAPYRMLRMTKAPWPLNREGFRARELETYRGHFLVEFLGGSVCLGVGTNTGPTLAERLEAALTRRGLRNAEVVNLCQGGATSAQELAIFLEYGLLLHPQFVISFDGANDLLHPRPVGTDDAANLPYRDREMHAGFEGRHSVLAHLAVIRLGLRVAGRSAVDPAAAPAVPVEDVIGSYIYTLGLTRQLTEDSGAQYAVLLQPTLHYRKPWSDEETRMWNQRNPRYGAAVSSAAARIYDAGKKSLGSWAAQSRVHLVDLTGVFELTSGTVYSDSVHFSGDRGYAALFAEIDKQGLVEEIERAYRKWTQEPRESASTAVEPRGKTGGRTLWAQ